MSRRPTMADVAARAGVSLKTVSRVVNRVPTVDPVLAERVRAAVTELGFRPNQLAAALKAGTGTRTIGLVVSDFPSVLVPRLVAGVTAVARTHATQVITVLEEHGPGSERAVVEDLCNRRVDGLLLVPSAGGPTDHIELGAEAARGVPLVFLDRPARGLTTDTVLVRDTEGARAGVARLVAAGHRSVGVLLATPTRASQFDRWTGARAALAEAGVLLSQSPQLTGLDARSAADAAVDLLTGRPGPTALFAGDATVACAVVAELVRRDLDVPVVAFDDFPMSRIVPLPLAVVAWDTEEMGRQGARMLFERLADPALPTRTVHLPATPVEPGLRGLGGARVGVAPVGRG